jgi:hypothetical protein
VVAVAWLGCFDTQDDQASVAAVDEPLVGDFSQAQVFGSVTAVHNATLLGDVGAVQDLHHYATAVESYGDGEWLSFEVTVDTGDQAAMAILNITNLSSLDMTGNADGLAISLVGCAGRDPGVWDFDASADEVDYDVTTNSANPKEVTLTYTAEIPDWSAANGSGLYNPVADVPHFTLSGTLQFVLP